MGTLLLTVAWGARRRDLAVRSDVPIADLLAPLAAALAAAEDGAGAPLGALAGPPASTPASTPDPSSVATAVMADRHPGESLALAPLAGVPLPRDRSLEACGVGDGSVLVLVGRGG